MEIADVFVVNKADREGADRTVASLEAMLALQAWDAGEWRPPIVKTQATTGQGVADLLAAVEAFRATRHQSGVRRRSRAEFRLRELLGHRFLQHLEQHVLGPGELGDLLDRIAARHPRPLHGRRPDPGRALGPERRPARGRVRRRRQDRETTHEREARPRGHRGVRTRLGAALLP